MKVQTAQLSYFKRFRDLSLDFTDPETGLAKNLVLLVGINGIGKSSILQAIAATVGTACGRINHPEELNWPGFNWEVSDNNWSGFNSRVDLAIEFSTNEIEATRSFSEEIGSDKEKWTIPSTRRVVQLHLTKPNVRAISPDGKEALFQLKGREYAKQLVRHRGFKVLEQVGTVLWYTEQRTSTSLTPEDPRREIDLTQDVLRDRLSKWRQFHQSLTSGQIKELRPGQKDLYKEIESAYQTVFPSRIFEGPVPRQNIDDFLEEPWFYLSDGERQYEISEMSGGERAIFPILVDFVRWNVHNSIVLIDELELHLHPPMQQAFLRSLPSLGKNNQFIISTHSDYIEELVPDNCVFRIDS
ncbi:AAA family ATPase [Oscillatoria sp. CS-180]|uniref:AAA family ATPase n=1 Tax=Oscillatoria sp. CS-180 TaxID=3021720 RepID=UPI00232DF739|nr:AAA family ATPase [Oscillatoria sp. CS-180]MDB9529012.1 AAA family ATPase [Oscillatoria sp. CS-180]